MMPLNPQDPKLLEDDTYRKAKVYLPRLVRELRRRWVTVVIVLVALADDQPCCEVLLEEIRDLLAKQ